MTKSPKQTLLMLEPHLVWTKEQQQALPRDEKADCTHCTLIHCTASLYITDYFSIIIHIIGIISIGEGVAG